MWVWVYNNLISNKGMGREIKKSVIVESRKQEEDRDHSRERSRDQHKEQRIRQAEIEEVNASRRREILLRNRQRQQQEEEEAQKNQIKVQKTVSPQPLKFARSNPGVEKPPKAQQPLPRLQLQAEPSQQQELQAQQQQIVLHKPIFVGKQERETLRNQDTIQQKIFQQQSKKIKIGRLNTKLLLNETLKAEGEDEDEELEDSDLENVEMPDDDDTKDEALQHEHWKIRQLKRIRRDREERNKFALQQADVERRRKMTDQERLAENKKLGSDLTDNTETTKYVYMQKYYHQGAFYQDSEDAVLKRNYNLPTAMELQDKTMLPKILQKRRNDFGRKGQSKHTHLTDVDTTNFDPKTKADEGVMIGLQKKMAGYKDAFFQKKR